MRTETLSGRDETETSVWEKGGLAAGSSRKGPEPHPFLADFNDKPWAAGLGFRAGLWGLVLCTAQTFLNFYVEPQDRCEWTGQRPPGRTS